MRRLWQQYPIEAWTKDPGTVFRTMGVERWAALDQPNEALVPIARAKDRIDDRKSPTIVEVLQSSVRHPDGVGVWQFSPL